MQFKHLRDAIEQMHKAHPEIDEAEVKVNLEHSVVDLGQIAHFLQKGVVVLFPVGMLTGTMAPTKEQLDRLKREQADFDRQQKDSRDRA